jgi:Fic family protein
LGQIFARQISRILTIMLLLKNSYLYVSSSSLEAMIEENKEAYYLALRIAQSTLSQGDEKLGEWLLFFSTIGLGARADCFKIDTSPS